MTTEFLGILLMFVATVVLAIPLGRYIARVYAGEKTFLDSLFAPIERLFYRLSGINPTREMTWQQHLVALLTINLVWFLWAMLLLLTQGSLPLNPDANPSMSPHLAFNTAISFLVNCNLQHYSGESGMSYLGQIFCLQFLQFVSAGYGDGSRSGVVQRPSRPHDHPTRQLLRLFSQILYPHFIAVVPHRSRYFNF